MTTLLFSMGNEYNLMSLNTTADLKHLYGYYF